MSAVFVSFLVTNSNPLLGDSWLNKIPLVSPADDALIFQPLRFLINLTKEFLHPVEVRDSRQVRIRTRELCLLVQNSHIDYHYFILRSIVTAACPPHFHLSSGGRLGWPYLPPLGQPPLQGLIRPIFWRMFAT